MTGIFKNRKLVIATKHKKEDVITPLFEKSLGVKCFVPEDFDTDFLGTFTGEIKRKHDPITTARKKCLEAMKLTNCDLGIASEGSFGPHPSLFFAASDEEFLIFIDKKNNLEIIERELSLETNYNQQKITTEKELIEFAKHVKFPSHGLILRKSESSNSKIIKGITDWETLKDTFKMFIDKYGKAYVETDMRAMHNPVRMKVIETAVKKLINKINTICPECSTPGFERTEAVRGLPCSLCSSPTDSILSYVYTCKKCAFKEEKNFPNKKTKEDPEFCNVCNP